MADERPTCPEGQAVDVTLLHFANLRLGTSFPTLGPRGRDQRAQLVATLESLADLAVAEHAHAVVISGDLFGCPVPAPSTLKSVRAFFARLRDSAIPAVIRAGSRDPQNLFGPTQQAESHEYLEGAILLDRLNPRAAIESLGLVFQWVSLSHPDRSTVTDPDRRHQPTVVGVACRDSAEAVDLAALADAFADTGITYLAVGGDLGFSVHQRNGLTVCSPGVPEPLEWGQEEGSVALVQISAGTVSVHRGRTGTRSLARRDLELTLSTAHDVVSLIADQGREDLGLEVILRGQCPGHVLIDPATIESELGARFFSLRVIDQTELVIDAGQQSDLPRGTVLGNFVR
ncbi:MAG: hypothetical protein ACRDGS_04915, partial [Chloroflexota bacterium]